jgi:hypothetical protein
MKKTTVYLPDDLKTELERAAGESGCSEAEIIRAGIQWAVAQHLPPAPRHGIYGSGDPYRAEKVDELLRGFGRR